MPSLRIVKNDATNISKGIPENTNGFNLFMTPGYKLDGNNSNLNRFVQSGANKFIGPRVKNIRDSKVNQDLVQKNPHSCISMHPNFGNGDKSIYFENETKQNLQTKIFNTNSSILNPIKRKQMLQNAQSHLNMTGATSLSEKHSRGEGF